MSPRERWTVYPLLFLTLGIALKDKIVKLVNVDRVACKTLVVTDQQGNERVLIASGAFGGFVKADGLRGVGVVLGQVDNRAGVLYVDSRSGTVLGPSFTLPVGAPRTLPLTPSDAPADAPAEQPATDQPTSTPQEDTSGAASEAK
jgi:hypothetical protein